MSKARKLLTNPVYYLSVVFPFFRRFLSDYQKKYGVDSDAEYYLKKMVMKKNKKSEPLNLVCADKKFTDFFSRKRYTKISVYDFDEKRLKKTSKVAPSSALINSKSELMPIKNGVYFNILNSLNESDRELFLSKFDEKIPCAFYGSICDTEKKNPLGPEPIGTFGCAQYDTRLLKEQLSKHFKKISFTITGDVYIAFCEANL